ncbi:MAG TPA: DUF1501 domain-containing protein, partial [Planctomycetaceae bacterium]|nr:DUF1501 domain-containing protein [Planctomycetaceae bacterium]
EHPVRPGDLAATVLRALGIPDDFTYQDREGRAHRLLDDGKPLPLFG